MILRQQKHCLPGLFRASPKHCLRKYLLLTSQNQLCWRFLFPRAVFLWPQTGSLGASSQTLESRQSSSAALPAVTIVTNGRRNDKGRNCSRPCHCQLARFISVGADCASASCRDFHSSKVALPSSLSKYERIAGSRCRANASIASAGT